MKSILRFAQLFESVDLDDEGIQELFQDIQDELNIEFSFRKGYFNEKSDNLQWLSEKPISKEDKLAYLILINLGDMRLNKLTRNLNILYNDDRFFELFAQIRAISKRYKTYTQILNSSSIRLLILVDEVKELEEDVEMYKLYTQIKDKFDRMKSDFAYSTVVKFEDNKITIKTDGLVYTDRKLNSALRGLDFSNFKITQKREGKGLSEEVFNIIEIK